MSVKPRDAGNGFKAFNVEFDNPLRLIPEYKKLGLYFITALVSPLEENSSFLSAINAGQFPIGLLRRADATQSMPPNRVFGAGIALFEF